MFVIILTLLFFPRGLSSELDVTWNDSGNYDFDESLIEEVNSGKISKIELPSLKVIFPGTLWCGDGNISKSVDDLGFFKETDACCRTHDMCDDIIRSGATKYNLTNPALYTRLNCKCDIAFYNCLHKSNSISSNKIGFIYFTILDTKCFRKDYPITGCKKKKYIPSKRCLEYEYDTNGEKKYQWFDVPFWNYGSFPNKTTTELPQALLPSVAPADIF